MHSISVPDDIYQALAAQAAARNLAIDELVRQAVDQLSIHPMPSESLEPTTEQRLQAFDQWTRRIEERADRYPPGFRVDDSREAMYEDRLRSQL
jgi:hypothetical protein